MKLASKRNGGRRRRGKGSARSSSAHTRLPPFRPCLRARLTEEEYRTSAAARTEEDEAMDEVIRQQDARRAGQYNILEEPMDK